MRKPKRQRGRSRRATTGGHFTASQFRLRDLIATAGVLTTGGTGALSDWVPREDATIWQRLRQSGAVLLGKVNLHEMAAGGTGLNQFYGPARNPWATIASPADRAAAAMAAHLCLASIGSDTGGSIRGPAGLCGIVGLKPTFSLVSTRGALYLAWTNDHLGPMTKTVEGAALVLNVIAGYDPAYALSAPVSTEDYTSQLNGDLKGLRLAVPTNYFWELQVAEDGGSTRMGPTGSVLAGLFPLLFIGMADKVTIYRIATYFGIGLWFLSLIPALLLRDFSSPAAPREAHPAGLRGYLSGIRHPRLMLQLAIPSALITLGAGFVLPLMNVFFHEHMHLGEMEIGSTFAISSAFVAVGALLSPLVAARFDRISAVTLTRLISVPFILMLGFAANMGEMLVPSLSIAGLAFVARAVFMNMSFPIENAFEMEVLDRQERATYVAVESTISSMLRALAGLLGASLMASGDFQTPFLIMAALTLGSTVIYYLFFRKGVPVSQVAPVGTAGAA